MRQVVLDDEVRMLVTGILTGAIMPDEMDAGVVRCHLLNVADMVTK